MRRRERTPDDDDTVALTLRGSARSVQCPRWKPALHLRRNFALDPQINHQSPPKTGVRQLRRITEPPLTPSLLALPLHHFRSRGDYRLHDRFLHAAGSEWDLGDDFEDLIPTVGIVDSYLASRRSP